MTDPTPESGSFEEAMAAMDRIIHDKKLQQELLDVGLLVRVDPETGEPDPADPQSRETDSPTEALARAVLQFVDWDEEDGRGTCRWCGTFYASVGHRSDCPATLALGVTSKALVSADRVAKLERVADALRDFEGVEPLAPYAADLGRWNADRMAAWERVRAALAALDADTKEEQ